MRFPFWLLFVTLRKTEMIQLFQNIGTKNNTTRFFQVKCFSVFISQKNPLFSFC